MTVIPRQPNDYLLVYINNRKWNVTAIKSRTAKCVLIRYVQTTSRGRATFNADCIEWMYRRIAWLQSLADSSVVHAVNHTVFISLGCNTLQLQCNFILNWDKTRKQQKRVRHRQNNVQERHSTDSFNTMILFYLTGRLWSSIETGHCVFVTSSLFV